MIDVKASGDLEALTKHVLDSAKETAKAMIERARVRADEIARKAEERSQERKQELVHAGRIGVERARKQILSQAKLRLKEDLLATKAKILDQAVSQTRKHLEHIASEDGKAYLGLLVKLSKGALSGRKADHVMIYLSTSDAKRYENEIKRAMSGELGDRIEIRTGEISGGVVAELPEEHLQIDASFDELLREVIPKINEIVEKEVFLSRGGHKVDKDGK